MITAYNVNIIQNKRLSWLMNENHESQFQSNPRSSNTPSILDAVTLAWASATPSSNTETSSTPKSLGKRNHCHTPEKIAKELMIDDNGVLWWRRKTRNRNMRKPVGYVDFQGKHKDKPYIRLSLDKVPYKRSIIVFCLHYNRWPDTDKVIDHIDGNSLNDHPLNLREISQRENCSTSRIRRDNTSGVKGISFVSGRNKYEAYIHKNGKKISGGNFDTKEEAILARIELELELGGNSNTKQHCNSVNTFNSISIQNISL